MFGFKCSYVPQFKSNISGSNILIGEQVHERSVVSCLEFFTSIILSVTRANRGIEESLESCYGPGEKLD